MGNRLLIFFVKSGDSENTEKAGERGASPLPFPLPWRVCMGCTCALAMPITMSLMCTLIISTSDNVILSEAMRVHV